MDYRIYPPEEFLEARVTLPLSKSMSARALIINALTEGATALGPVAECDDTEALARGLASLTPDAPVTVNVGHAGTAMRFLAAYFASRPGAVVTLDGSERMRQRPIGILVDALRALGADIEYAGQEGYPPLAIRGRQLCGGELSLDSTVSSQYISALMMIAPTLTSALTIRLEGMLTSRPYVDMTIHMMRQAGVEAELYRDVITIPNTPYRPYPFEIEGDWSGAAAWYEIEALAAGTVDIANLTDDSCQGDRRLADIFAKMGVDTLWESEEFPGGISLMANPDPDARATVDFTYCPDLAQYAVATCVMLGIPFRFSGLHTLRIKETDRVEALRREFAKIGVELTTPTLPNDPAAVLLEWDGRRMPIRELPAFDTYADHRMAMCLAPVSIFIPGITVRDIEVVSKSYPGYWDDLAAAGFTLEDASVPHVEAEAE